MSEAVPDDVIEIDKSPTAEKEASAEFSDPENERKHLDNRSFKQDMRQRKTYAFRSYKITIGWVAFLMITTIAQMVCHVAFNSGLESTEFVTVFTTTTGSVFGYWWLVGRYLFKGPEKPEKLPI